MTSTRAVTRSQATAVMALLAGAAVAVLLGVYGNSHSPSGETIATFGFSSMIAMKVWLGAIAGVLALVQFVLALWMYGRLGRPAPAGVGTAHRATGVAAVLVSLPVGYHCLWSLGFQSYDTRVLLHSTLGCLFYGAFVTKVVAVRRGSTPRWMLPLAGGLLFTALVLVVLTSSVWYLRTFGAPA